MKKVLATLVCDPIHSGHINILKTAKSYGYVIAGLVTDEGNEQKCNLNGSTPLLPFKERYAVLSSIKYVDEVIPVPLVFKDVLLDLKPDLYVHGDDWKNSLSGLDASVWSRDMIIKLMATWGGSIVEPAYTKDISSSSIKSNFFLAD